MLSFLNEDNQGQTAAELNNDQQQSQGQEQIIAEQDYLVPAHHGKNLKQSTILLAALFGIGALCVWFMIAKIKPQAASASATDSSDNITNVIQGLKGVEAEMSRADGIAGKFFSPDVDQVGVDELKKNPFVSEIGGGPAEVPIFVSVNKGEIERQANAFQLDSIIESHAGSSCIIDGKRLRVGDKIQAETVTFTIENITSKYVEITANGQSVKLMM